MIVFSAFTPHSPLLLESISKDRYHDFDGTLEAMNTLRERLQASRPEVVVVIATHSHSYESAFAINVNDTYRVSLAEFGDHATTKSFKPDLELITQLRRTLRAESIECTLDSQEVLEYGPGVPLLLLTGETTQKIVPISFSGLDAKTHLAFGRLLKDVCVNSSKRIAIIASGDLSHSLSTQAPMGFKKEGRVFDDAVLEAVKNVSPAKLLKIPAKVIKESSECAYRPLLVFFGLHERMRVRPEILSYEAPRGVGYLVVELRHTGL